MLCQQIQLILPEGIYDNVEVLRATYIQDVNSSPNLIHTKDSLVKIYDSWQSLNSTLALEGARGVNIPEGLTENLYCYLTGAYRTNNIKLSNCNTSFDCYLPSNIANTMGKRIQIKACSISPDLTSFGPHSVWDQLIFIDFSLGNGNFNIYDIPNNLIYSRILNTKKNETFVMQQSQGRRPRLSLIQVINENKLTPIFNGNIYTLPIL